MRKISWCLIVLLLGLWACGSAAVSARVPSILFTQDTAAPFAPIPTNTRIVLPTLKAPSPTPSPIPFLHVYFINVGQGDSIFIQTFDGDTILIDGGKENQKALDFLLGLGVTQIDIVIATHPHPDHVGGLTEVLQRIPVSKIYMNGQSEATPEYERFMAAVTTTGVECQQIGRGDVITIGDLVFTVLSPLVIDPAQINNNSLVLRMIYRNTSFLFTADIDDGAEYQILGSGATIGSDIIKLGHHGGSGSSSTEFLNAVDPTMAIYSTGYENTGVFPDLNVLERLRDMGVVVYGTDVNGTILITTDGEEYLVTASKQAAPVTIP